MTQELKIATKNAIVAYNNADANGKRLLENLFGKETFTPKDIRDKVKTFEDAVAILGNEHPFVLAWNSIYQGCEDAYDSDIQDVIAYHKLRIIAAALNEGWKPKFDGEERRYYIWFCIYSKEEYDNLDIEDKADCRVVGRSHSNARVNSGMISTASYSSTNFGSRLTFKTKELAEYCGKQFIDIWEKFLFA